MAGDRAGRVLALDGLRGVAVFLVVFHHGYAEGSGGTVGVTLFFVLSGFLITRLLLDEHGGSGRVDLGRFWVRRARRLLPGLGLLLLVCLALGAPLQAVAASALYGMNIWLASGHIGSPLDHAWSLSLEEQFYLLWPLALLALLRARRCLPYLLIVAIAGVTVWRAVLVTQGAGWLRIGFGPDTRVDALLLGCLLAVLAREIPARAVRWAAPPALVVLAWASFLPIIEGSAWMMLGPVTAASGVLVAWAATSSATVLTWRPLRALGRISYGVYLWHFPIAMAVHRMLAPGWISFSVIAGVSVAVAAVSWTLVERPLQGMPRPVTVPTPRAAPQSASNPTTR